MRRRLSGSWIDLEESSATPSTDLQAVLRTSKAKLGWTTPLVMLKGIRFAGGVEGFRWQKQFLR